MDVVARVRQFNRTVTQHIGVLDDHYLARDRPLGESRLLWEIDEGADVRSLRERLGLDSGYVSRLLRSLERDGLVEVVPGAPDRRVRVARLTAAGQAERQVLDERSDELAASLLAPLNAAQQARLVAAMAEVDRLLTAGLVAVDQVDPAHPHARHCLAAYVAELDHRFEGGFDTSASISAADHELRLPHGLLLVATLHGDPIGCGVLRLDGRVAQLKRMWVDDSRRGLGIGRRLLGELETHAAAHGAATIHLETNNALTEAIALYRATGYTEVPAFNDEHYAHRWFEKHL